ncbi:hypothetical protein BT96DRAFT_462308 [Gymnopus androsaceus JB14]|uniref:Uncharacterized protein n=1 Tax=Gymnopus androsaceus JB14 TaxID=1447944 RepID=A0A6A4ILH9_9AGAR|nr:hypothetical protein BT96DRAFT_462308 [Gymnopus androsaceus JB14]
MCIILRYSIFIPVILQLVALSLFTLFPVPDFSRQTTYFYLLYFHTSYPCIHHYQ